MLVAGCGDGANQRLVGQLESERVELAAEFAEPVRRRLVDDGARVAAGDIVVELDAARIEARLREAAARVEESRARLDELVRGPRQEQIAATRANVAGAREALAFRRKELARARDVFRRNLGSAESVDQAQAAVDTAAAELDALEARLEELLSGTTSEELSQAEQRLVQVEASLEGLQIERDRHRVTAPAAGIIDAVLVEPGEVPQPGQAVAILLTGDQPYARIYVPEPMRVQVTRGTRATVYIDGRERPVTGRVRWVSREAAFTPYFALTEHDRGRLTYVAEIDLETDEDRLPDGVPVQVELDLSADHDDS